MEIKEILIEALSIIEDIEINEAIKPIAFGKAVDIIVHQHDLSNANNNQEISSMASQSDNDGIKKIANKLKLSNEPVEKIYDIDGDEFTIHIMSSKLETSKRKGTQQIALLAAAGRQASGIDDKNTDIDVIRLECEHYKKYDSANFASTIKSMELEFIIKPGKGNKRFIKMSNPGWEKASELIKQLTSDSE